MANPGFLPIEGVRIPQARKNGAARQRWIVASIVLALAIMMCSILVLASSASAQDETGGEDDLAPGYGIHAALMTLATIFFVASYVALWLKILTKQEAGVLPAITTKVSRHWYRLHMYLGSLGVMFALAGVIWGFLIVQWAYGGPHLRYPHSYVGYMVGGIALAPVFTGFLARAIKKGRATARWWHMAIGLIGIAMMAVGTFSGLSLD